MATVPEPAYMVSNYLNYNTTAHQPNYSAPAVCDKVFQLRGDIKLNPERERDVLPLHNCVLHTSCSSGCTFHLLV